MPDKFNVKFAKYSQLAKASRPTTTDVGKAIGGAITVPANSTAEVMKTTCDAIALFLIMISLLDCLSVCPY